jgi:hypothetical protein
MATCINYYDTSFSCDNRRRYFRGETCNCAPVLHFFLMKEHFLVALASSSTSRPFFKTNCGNLQCGTWWVCPCNSSVTISSLLCRMCFLLLIFWPASASTSLRKKCSLGRYVGTATSPEINFWADPEQGGPGSSVDIATDYELDGPGIESWWGRDISHTSRPALGPNQPPVCTVGTGSFPGVKRPGRGADHPSPPSADVENE